MSDARSELDDLVRRHMEAGFRFAIRLCGSIADAEDLLQEALVRVVQRFAELRDRGAFRTWFFRIILNVARDRYRTGKYDVAGLELAAELEQPGQPEWPVEAAELKELVRRYIQDLPPRQREALILRVYEAMSYEEAAEIMETSPENVRALVSYARRNLAQRLRPYLTGENEDTTDEPERR